MGEKIGTRFSLGNNNKDEKKELDSLRNEISIIKQKEENGESKTVHFEDINLENLTSDDIHIYSLFKEEKLTPIAFVEYKNKLNQGDKNSLQFAAWIGNLLSEEENMKWFDPESYESLQIIRKRKEAREIKE